MPSAKEEFIVSARKYRPHVWAEVIGQEAITDTLHNAITEGHLAHAYLFCGPRGVGKTTCARIFAREINSESQSEDEDFSFNIFELDAASNNKTDDIRALTDQVRIPPQVGKYKVYIIDEVHMLSSQAFNAFLKTLEEPPKHAIFILATTEKHKIIPTILSRCQIYDFNRIPVPEIIKHLRQIAEKENYDCEEEALHVIARKADGALRDALSIFDQLAVFTKGKLTYEAVLKNLHVLDYEFFFRVSEQLHSGDYASVMLTLDEVLKQGFDGGHFLSSLASHFRDLLVCMDPRTTGLLEVPDNARKQYAEQSRSIGPEWIFEALKSISQAEFKMRGTSNARLSLEVALLNIAAISSEKKNTDPLVTRNIDPAPRTNAPLSDTSAPTPSVTEQPQRELRMDMPLQSSLPRAAASAPTKAHESESKPSALKEPEGNPLRQRTRKTTTVSLRMEEEGRLSRLLWNRQSLWTLRVAKTIEFNGLVPSASKIFRRRTECFSFHIGSTRGERSTYWKDSDTLDTRDRRTRI